MTVVHFASHGMETGKKYTTYFQGHLQHVGINISVLIIDVPRHAFEMCPFTLYYRDHITFLSYCPM